MSTVFVFITIHLHVLNAVHYTGDNDESMELVEETPDVPCCKKA